MPGKGPWASAPKAVVMTSRLEGEELRTIRCTSGETTVWKMVEDGFAEPGQFSGETTLYWHDAAEAGAVQELALPMKKPGPSPSAWSLPHVRRVPPKPGRNE